MMLPRQPIHEIEARANLTVRPPDGARILIICTDDWITEQMETAFRRAGFISQTAKSITEGCAFAKSGRFQLVITTPVLADGSWRRLVDIARHNDLGFVVVLVASNFDINQWAEAMEDGVFDVLDPVHELPRAAEVAKRALWAAYLKGAWPRRPKDAIPPKAA
jgi:two-component system nitrogen regulation response regulator GlnG